MAGIFFSHKEQNPHTASVTEQREREIEPGKIQRDIQNIKMF